MSQPSPPAPIQRLNPRALAVLAVVAVGLVVVLGVYLDQHDHGLFLREARKRLDARQADLLARAYQPKGHEDESRKALDGVPGGSSTRAAPALGA
jgi:hypothetical protein